jgi:tetratricopeptide (TPR) repeat protein
MERFAHAGAFEDLIPIAGPPLFVSAHELLGTAYLKAGHPDSAAGQFERVLANQPKRSAALLGLARARVALGDRDAAVKAYSQLLANWHRADADLPDLAEVRAGATGKFTSALGVDAGLSDYVRFAVLPLPEQMRAGATVMRIDSTGRVVLMRQGSNGIVCMRFVPGERAWDARCYEATMFRVVLRMRELFLSGVAPPRLVHA